MIYINNIDELIETLSEGKHSALLSSKKKNDIPIMPYYSYSPAVHELIISVRKFDADHPEIDFPNNKQMAEQYGICWDNEDTILNADVSVMDGIAIMALLSTIIRKEKLHDGFIQKAINHGTIDTCLKKLKEEE